MAIKSGQARVPTEAQWDKLYLEISKHRHPEKNTAIMQVSQKLGLRAQEISLLEIKEVCVLHGKPGSNNRGFKLLEIMPLPSSYTKGSNAKRKSTKKYAKRSVSFKVEEFDRIVNQIVELTKANVKVSAKNFYPITSKRKGLSRDLPIVDKALKEALIKYIQHRLDKDPYLKLTDPLFKTQKNGPYSPNTLQEHMSLMLRGWAGIERSTSHSGRRYVITNIIHKQKKSLKIAQKIAGHKSPATTVIYEEPPEEEISDALDNINKKS